MINLRDVPVPQYQALLDKFPEQYHDKLSVYTAEELFYCVKLCTHEPKNPKALTSGDVLMLTLKAKLFRWLKDKACQCQAKQVCKHKLAPKSLADLSCSCESPAPKLCMHGIHPNAWVKVSRSWRPHFEEFLQEGQEEYGEEVA